MKPLKKIITGVFRDPDTVLAATKELRKNGQGILEVYTPYPVHGLDQALGISRSRLPFVTLIAGLAGLTLSLFFQIWVFTRSWPMNVGGKPHLALPAFIPITFELTVLIGGLTTVAVFFLRSCLFPGKCAPKIDLKATDDHFVIAIEQLDASVNVAALHEQLRRLGAVEVGEKEVCV